MLTLTEFFRDEQILITGGTGFVGRLLINKLLLSCSKLKKIILLVRVKENDNLEKCKRDLFANEIFEKLRRDRPDYVHKVELVEGNCECTQLGLTQINKFLITQHVTVIFHCAANVQFDKDLKTEINVNVFGALEILNLAKYVRNLKALVYVSSSYSNCHRPVIEEKYYKPDIHYATLLKLTEYDFLNTYEKRILGNVKSTYFYSKAAAEQAVHERGKGLPIAIFRPSAIISTWKEPIPGWTTRAFAVTALVKGIILGYFSSILCTDDTIVDMVPADLTVNALIAVAWDTHNRFINGALNEPRIYNYVSMPDNPITLKKFLNTVFDMISENPCSKSIWYPGLHFNETQLTNTLNSLLRPRLLIFAIQLVNIIKRSTSENIRLQQVCKTYDLFMDLLKSIVQTPHIYTNDNIRELWNDMAETDKQTFLFDLKQFQWNEYLRVYYDGVLRYVLKERTENKLELRRHLQKLQTISCVMEALLYATIMFILYFLLFR